MKFGGRDLPPYAEPVKAADLDVGDCYFSVTFADTEMTIPLIESMVFVGRDLEPGDAGLLYFQDVESFREGTQYNDSDEASGVRLFVCSPNECSAIFVFDRALDELLRCAVRRGLV